MTTTAAQDDATGRGFLFNAAGRLLVMRGETALVIATRDKKCKCKTQ